MPTHKKGHDKDKYYYLAKDQGYRSRASYKLIQINKRYDFLTKAKVCIDLCAAPGGWCQVAEKNMAPGSIVIGVDLLPIRPIRNVKTIVNDITTPECRKQIQTEMQGWKADVVLCDGAPNIGSAYSKDAYVQNELVIAALKTATDHLIEGGTFCTKVYRSVDYNAIIWVLQQLFQDVQTIKPNSSRSQSSEIFLVCMKYTAPKQIDPKLLDPNYVFKEVKDPGLKTVDVLHKKYDKLNKRHRTGYDENLGLLLSKACTVSQFLAHPDPVQVLTEASELSFSPLCKVFQDHDSTTLEMKLCLKDLRVLGKIDFKKILKWRQGLRAEFAIKTVGQEDEVDEVERVPRAPKIQLNEEEQIAQELDDLKSQMTQKQRKEKKKLREKAALAQRRLQAGMANNAFSAESDVELFSALVANSLVSKTSKSGDIDDDDVDNEEDEWVNGYDGEGEEDEEEYDRPDLVRGGVEYDELEDMEQELDYDYKRYLTKKRQKEDAAELVDTLKDKKKASKAKAKGADPDLEIDLEEEDDEEEAVVERNADDYIDHDNDGKHLDAKITKKRKVNPSKQAALKHASEWFSNPIFQEAETLRLKTAVTAAEEELEEEEEAERAPINGPVRDDDVEMIEHEDLMPDMPKTDKMIRKEKRKKQQERNQRKQDRRQLRDAPQVEDEDEAMDKLNKSRAQANIPGANKDRVLTEADLRRMRLIEKGLGKKVGLKDDAGGFEVVPREVDEEMHVHRVHGEDDDDDNYEDIDSDDDDENMADEYVERGKRNRLPREKPTAEGRVMTLALGTLMLNKSRKKALIDSSYNRYSWSDSSDLPSWFTEDETRHNKPQVPVPAALLDQIKGRFKITGTKEIKKVAEARMRKRKRALNKLKAAKSKANAMAENTDMSQREKMKAISRAMKEAKITKPGKVYVTTKKSGGGGSLGTRTSAGQGKLKFVDKRLKKDRRADRANKKRSKK